MSDFKFNNYHSFPPNKSSSLSGQQIRTETSRYQFHPESGPPADYRQKARLSERKHSKSIKMHPSTQNYNHSPSTTNNNDHQQNNRRWSTTSSNSNQQFGQSDETKKRKRIQQACKACSFRRVKCNGEKPCETCIKNDEECIYGQAKKRGPAKGTTRGGGSSVSCIAGVNNGGKKNVTIEQYGQPVDSSSIIGQYHSSQKSNQQPQYSHRPSNETSSYAESNSSFTSPPFLPSPRSKQYEQVEYSRLPKEYPTSRQQNYCGEHGNSLSDTRNPFGDPYSRHNSYRDNVGSPAYGHQRHPSQNQTSTMNTNRALPLSSENVSSFSRSRDENEIFNSSRMSSMNNNQTNLYSGQNRPDEEGRSIRSTTRPNDSISEKSELSERRKQNLANQLHQNTDIGGQDLADLVLAQMFHERQKANKLKQSNRQEVNSSSQSKNHVTEKDCVNALFESDEKGNIVNMPDSLQLPKIPQEVFKKLFNVFWSVISLHWPLFLRKSYPTVDDLYKACENDHPFLMNSICSLSALVWDNSMDGGKLDSTENGSTLSARQLSTIFAVRAHYHHISAILNPNIESTAALLFLSLRETGAGRPSQAAHYCWTACRMVMDLGLHRQAEMAQIMGSSFTQIEDETRRRVYWSVYVIDKMMAIQLGRPPVLRDAESDCPLPSFEGEENVWTWDSLPQKFFSAETSRQLGPRPLNMATYFTNGCRLARISEPIIAQYNVVKGKQTIGGVNPDLVSSSATGTGGLMKDQSDWQSTVAYLHRQLEEWDQQTPMNLRWYANKGEAYFPYIIHQQMWAQACRILLHRPYILKPTDKFSGINSHAECSKATDAIWQMFRDYERLFSLRKVPSSTVYCLFSAATIALANTTSIEDDLCLIAKKQLCDIVGWFIQMTETWSSATQHLAILEKLASTINVDLSETGLQEPSLRAALHSKLESGTMGMFGAERLRKVRHSAERGGGGGLSDGKSGATLMEDIPSFNKKTRQIDFSSSSTANNLKNTSNNSNNITSLNGQFNVGVGNSGNNLTGLREVLSSEDAGAGSGEEQLDAFWPDMPLGEDFQRWLSFTHTYFTILGNGSSDSDQVQNQLSNNNNLTNFPSTQNVQQHQSQQQHQQHQQHESRNETEIVNGMPMPHSQSQMQNHHRSRQHFDRTPHLSSNSSSSPPSESFYPIPPKRLS